MQEKRFGPAFYSFNMRKAPRSKYTQGFPAVLTVMALLCYARRGSFCKKVLHFAGSRIDRFALSA